MKIINEIKGTNINILDFTNINNYICDYFLICSGNSLQHVFAIANFIEKKIQPLNKEGVKNGYWIILDYNTIIIHIFKKKTREYYNLEKLWGNVQTIKLNEHKNY